MVMRLLTLTVIVVLPSLKTTLPSAPVVMVAPGWSCSPFLIACAAAVVAAGAAADLATLDLFANVAFAQVIVKWQIGTVEDHQQLPLVASHPFERVIERGEAGAGGAERVEAIGQRDARLLRINTHPASDIDALLPHNWKPTSALADTASPAT